MLAQQLQYKELLNRNGGPWAWNEPGNNRDKALPRHALACLLEHLDVRSVVGAETTCFQWRQYMIAQEGVAVWQAATHRFLGRDRIERYKIALGLRSGQAFEQEREDLTAMNWKRILRMHRATKLLPTYPHDPFILSLPGHSSSVLCMCQGGPYLFTGGADKKLYMYRVPLLVHYTPGKGKNKAPPKPTRSFGQGGIAHSGPVLCLAAEKEFILSGGVDGLVKMWKLESAPDSPAKKVMEAHQGPVWSVCLIEGGFCCSGGADKTIRMWDLNGPKGAAPLTTMRGHSAGVTALCSTRRNGLVVSGSEDRWIRIWEPHRGLCISEMDGHQAIVFSVMCWSGTKNGTEYDLIFSGDGDGTIKVWDRPSALLLSTVEGVHTDAVRGMSMSLDPDRSLLSSSMDGTVRLWEPAAMTCERTLAGADGEPVQAGFTQAIAWANILFASSWDGEVRCFIYTE